MTGLSFRSSTLPRWKTNPKGLHTMYACLSGVKPRCALTPACQKTNPKGLLSPFVALGSNYVLIIILSMYTWFDLLIIPHKSRLLQPTNHPIKPHNYNTLVWGENSHRPSPTNFASNNPINPYLLHPINPNRRYEFLILHNQRRKYPPSNSLYASYNSFRPRLPPPITPSGLVFWQGRVKMCSVLTLPITHPHWQPLRVGLSKTYDDWNVA